MPTVAAVWVLMVHAGATCAMAGLIWFVQVVHYPLFAAVGSPDFGAYHRAHARLTTLVVGPLMLGEAAACLWLVQQRPPGVSPALIWSSVALLAVVWGATLFVSVPRHNLLAAGYDGAAQASLVSTNWIRTIAWTARALVALAMVATAGRR
jgi:hypothetical protein